MSKGLPRSLARGDLAAKPMVKRRIDLTGKTVTVSSTGAAIGFGSVVLDDFAEGNILVLGLGGTIGFAGSGADANLSDTFSGDFGIGTTPADDATITAGDVDLVASTAIGPATGEAIAAARVVSAVPPQATVFDNTDGSLEINLNVLIDAADIVDDTSVVLTLSGLIDVVYCTLGDD